MTVSAITFPANIMGESEKKQLALQVISNHKTLSNIADDNQVSRKFIYAQKNKMMNAIHEAFRDEKVNNDVLFHLPINKNWLKQFVTSLALDCRACFRGIMKSMKNLFDYDISLGGVYNILQSVIAQAKIINDTQDLSAIKLAAQDEIFQHQKPVLTGVDIPSLYCFLLSQENRRDGEI